MASRDNELHAAVLDALKGIQNSRTGTNVVEGEQIQELRIEDDGNVHFRFVLQPEDPGALVREARSVVGDVEGVEKVHIEVKLPETLQASRQKPKHGTREGGSGGGLKPGSVPAPTPDANRRSGIQRVVAVSSGKGGVGKSTVAANLAAGLAAAGHRVGLMDADVYGPDIPLLFGAHEKPKVTGEKGEEKIVPLESHGVRLISLGFLMDDEQPAIMRGPLVSGILKQFLDQVEWGELDYLIVDLPPGTGDAQLSLVQTIDLDGAVMVTTPQRMSTGDVRRAIRMFERVNTPVLGVVENMSGFVCPHCDETVDVFGRGGGRAMAESMQVDFLGEVPLDPRVREAGDEGRISALAAADSPAGRSLRKIVERIEEATMEAAAAGT